jgi:hypothetical protein
MVHAAQVGTGRFAISHHHASLAIAIALGIGQFGEELAALSRNKEIPARP